MFLRTLVASTVIVASSTVLLGQSDPGPNPLPAPKTERIPNKGWQARAGERAEVILPEIVGWPLEYDLRDYLRLAAAKDHVGIDQMMASGNARKLTRETKVLVIQTVNVKEYIPRTTSLTGFARGLQQGALSGPDDPEDVPSAEIRIVDGPFKDQSAWVALDGIGQMVDRVVPPPRVIRKKATPKPISAQDRSESLLSMGQALERSGNAAAATGYYREIVEKHHDQPAAEIAAERIKALQPK